MDANLTEAALAITEMQARIASLKAQLEVKDQQLGVKDLGFLRTKYRGILCGAEPGTRAHRWARGVF